jgi:hypothetical protein
VKAGLPPDGDITVPLVRVPAAEREIGGVAISVLGAGEIEKHQMRGLEPGDISDLADIVAGHESPSTVAFRLRPAGGTDLRSLNISVKRYTPQAVLIANIEEARYRVLAAEDGLFLIEARYAIRNNQAQLPESHAAATRDDLERVGRRQVRAAGVAEGEAVLLPLEKGRAGEDAPTFASDHLPAASRSVASDARALDLPALDLPVSRTGVELYHSPRFRVELAARAFRVESIPGVSPRRCASKPGYGFGIQCAGVAHAAPPCRCTPCVRRAPLGAPSADEPQATQFQTLIDRYRNEGGGPHRVGRAARRRVVPSMGPSLFMAAELTAESQRRRSISRSVESSRRIMTMRILFSTLLLSIVAHRAAAQTPYVRRTSRDR